VNAILKLFHKEIAGIHQAAILIGAFTFLSQILALVRDRLLAQYFGADLSLDLYYTSFRIPDLIYAGVASLVSISVLIPFLSNLLENKKEEARKFLNQVFTVFLLMIVSVSIIAFFAMPWLVKILFGQLGDADTLSELVFLSRLLLLQPIFLGISNLFGVITQIGKRFFVYALSPVFYNLSIIFGLIVLYPAYGIRGVAMGVVIGGLLHFIIQVPYSIRSGLVPRLTLDIDFRQMLKVARISIPRTVALSASMIELIAITALASTLTIGSISIFNLALNLQSVPLAIVGVSYTLAAFPTLSSCFAKGEKTQFMQHIATASKHIVFWSIPITALFVVLRAQIVRTVLGTGNFNWDNTRLTAACLALFVISLVAQGLKLLLTRSYYAAGKTSKPLAINLMSSIITIVTPFLLLYLFKTHDVFRYFMESLFKIEGVVGGEVLMLPLGYSIGTIFGAVSFIIIFQKDFGVLSKFISTLSASIQSAVVGGFTAYIGLNIFDNFFDLNTLAGIFTQGLLAGIMGIVAIFIVFKLLKNPEIEEILSALKQKVSKNKIIVSEPDKIEV
jgi:putative peptidoglycan lipid II flippase